MWHYRLHLIGKLVDLDCFMVHSSATKLNVCLNSKINSISFKIKKFNKVKDLVVIVCFYAFM